MTESKKPSTLNLADLENRMNTIGFPKPNALRKPESLGLGRRSLEETNKKPTLRGLDGLMKQNPSGRKPFLLNLGKNGGGTDTGKPKMSMNMFQDSQSNNNCQKKQIRFNVPEMPEKNVENDKLNDRLQLVLRQNGKLRFGEEVISTDVNSFDNQGQIGFGTCGQVYKMCHRPTKAIMAVKQMARTGNREENKRIMMDLEVVQKKS